MRPSLRAALGLLLLTACGMSRISTRVRPSGASAPARPRGCPITELPAAPAGATELGWLSVNCGQSVPTAECRQALLDEACALGAEVVWNVAEISKVQGREKWSARAGLNPLPSG